jgi:hypothetical protein
MARSRYPAKRGSERTRKSLLKRAFDLRHAIRNRPESSIARGTCMHVRNVVSVLLGAVLFIFDVHASTPGTESLYPYLRQAGLIADSSPMPFNAADDAILKLPGMPTLGAPASVPGGSGFIIYTEREGSYSYMAYTPGSEYFPSVVRRRVVFNTDHLETHTTLLCGADAGHCASLRKHWDTVDRICGSKVPGCPAYSGPVDKAPLDDELLLFLPRTLRYSQSLDGQPKAALLGILLVHHMRATFACQNYIGGRTPYEAAKHDLVEVSTAISNGDRAQALARLDSMSKGIEDKPGDSQLDEQFLLSGLSHEDRLATCRRVVADDLVRLHAAKKAMYLP